MSSLIRPPRPKKGGLSFSSTSQKMHRSDSPDSFPASFREPSLLEDTLTPSTTKGKIQTRILVISDTHSLSALARPVLQSQHEKIDILLHCGDLSECGTMEEYSRTLELLRSFAVPLKLVIPGNHDLTIDRNFWKSNCADEGSSLYDEAQALWTSSIVRDAGVRLLEEGTHTFVLENGAIFKIYASPYTINSQRVREWGFGYKSVEDRFNPKGEGVSYGTPMGVEQSILRGNPEVDVVMTHGPPKYILDVSSNSESLGCPHLFRAMRRTRPLLHAFGHVHNAYGAKSIRWKERKIMPEDDDADDGIQWKRDFKGQLRDGVRWIETRKNRGLDTLFLNAALMGKNGELDNSPWLVNIELERA